MADEAIAWAQRGDQTDSIADRYIDRAEIRRAAGQEASARADLEEAIRLYREKGNIPSQRRAQEMLAALRPPRTDGAARTATRPRDSLQL